MEKIDTLISNKEMMVLPWGSQANYSQWCFAMLTCWLLIKPSSIEPFFSACYLAVGLPAIALWVMQERSYWDVYEDPLSIIAVNAYAQESLL